MTTANSKSPCFLQLDKDLVSDKSEVSFNIDNTNELNLSFLKDEQSKIDTCLNFLLNYDCNKKKINRPKTRKNTTNSTPNSKNEFEVPDSVNKNFVNLVDINDIHAGVLLDYLNKVNQFNKKIISKFEELNKKYNNLCDEINGKVSLAKSCTCVGLATTHSLSSSNPVSDPDELPDNTATSVNYLNDNTESLKLKVDYLEQKNNSNVLICNGTFIDDLTSENTNSTNDVGNLRNKLSVKLKSILPDIKDSHIDKIITIGREKKRIKIICSSQSIKNSILYEARCKKLTDIYFSEFLTSYRLKLLLELRQLKNQNRDRIYACYTRNGNIFYKLSVNDNHVPVKTIGDIETLKSKMQ